jgi:Carboxypeptidase regulatory-like domain
MSFARFYWTVARCVVAVLLLAMQAGVSSGQIVSGSIVGTVVDASGGTIPGVKVTATNEETNLTRETLTNDSGHFAIPSLPRGRYRVAASQPDFKSAQVSGIELLIDQTVRVDLKLEVGNITDQITISADAVQLQTETATLGQVIEEKPITDLPLNGRNFIQLANLSAGVIPATSRSADSSRLGRVNVTAHVAGARASFNSFLMDGMENRGSRFGEVPILPSPDAIKEFKIQRNYYSAEYGQNVGIVSISIKSGTNGLHGSAYEFIRNDNLDARQFFDRGEPPEFKLNQFGFSMGGPIIRDRTFFFGAYEGRRQRRANQGFDTLPDPQWLLGDFSNRSTPIRDPF